MKLSTFNFQLSIFNFQLMEIKQLLPQHWPTAKAIYEAGIATGQATFETQAPEWAQWDKAHLSTARLVAVEDDTVDTVLGWATLTPVSGRCVYAGVAEVSVYVAEAARGKGVGKQLLQALVAASEAEGLWTLQAGIFPENTASVKIHEACGFRMVGYRERVGKLHGAWRNTVLMERRSQVVGTD
jgi:L-amino acid N-acyltransferase YncA